MSNAMYLVLKMPLGPDGKPVFKRKELLGHLTDEDVIEELEQEAATSAKEGSRIYCNTEFFNEGVEYEYPALSGGNGRWSVN